ncbi:MAG TPA: threonine synthase [Planctomycetes bacterium]|nr:threonine synthase [Planctomycetota bacterium]
MPVTLRSTNRAAPHATFREALLRGQAPDRGLYVPVEIPRLPAGFWEDMRGAPYAEVARAIVMPFVEGFIAERELAPLLAGAYDFPVPIEDVRPGRCILRLDRGPTLSFKDFAARLMARLMAHALAGGGGRLCVLAATSGDTGGAVASAFLGLPGIEVVVLFPLGEISARQRLQMTTLGGNVAAIGVEGKFDDCQRMVKQAFADEDLRDLALTSANSINFGRLVPQAVYYAYAYLALAARRPGAEVVFSVPSGNFGNLCGGVIARRMGLPVKTFVVGTNANDEFPRFLASGAYEKIEPSRTCISSAMNVGHPSNLARLVDFYGGRLDHDGVIEEQPDMDALRRDFQSVSVDDDATRRAMRAAYRDHGVVLDPHGAVAWHALDALRPRGGDELQVAIATAHPAKFPEEVEAAIGGPVPAPAALAALERRREEFAVLPPSCAELKKFLREEVAHGGGR